MGPKMTIQAHLDTLRRGTAGCQLTAFGDLSSKLILRSSSAAARPREELDNLCTKAATCFAVLDLETAGNLLGNGHYGNAAIFFTPGKSVIFARPSPETDDMTCAVIESAQDVEQALHGVRKTVAQIAEDSQ